MAPQPKKPKLFLNFILAIIVIILAFALDTYNKRLKVEKSEAAIRAADTAAVIDTADTVQDTASRLNKK